MILVLIHCSSALLSCTEFTNRILVATGSDVGLLPQRESAPPHVTFNQIFAGMLPFMGIQILAIVLLYTFPAIGLWLPEVLYK
jgi:hypothetical protein